MKFYDSIGPNPKLVRMFAAEKGFAFDETETVDLMAGANRQGPYEVPTKYFRFPRTLSK
jgi:hypothetical protein